MSQPFNLVIEINQLVDAWCQRRALNPLRILLPAWPLPNQPLSDHVHELLTALRHVRSVCCDELPEGDLLVVNKAVAHLQVALNGPR